MCLLPAFTRFEFAAHCKMADVNGEFGVFSEIGLTSSATTLEDGMYFTFFKKKLKKNNKKK